MTVGCIDENERYSQYAEMPRLLSREEAVALYLRSRLRQRPGIQWDHNKAMGWFGALLVSVAVWGFFWWIL